MRTFFFDMKDGVPMRDRVGIDFKNDLEAIELVDQTGILEQEPNRLITPTPP